MARRNTGTSLLDMLHEEPPSEAVTRLAPGAPGRLDDGSRSALIRSRGEDVRWFLTGRTGRLLMLVLALAIVVTLVLRFLVPAISAALESEPAPTVTRTQTPDPTPEPSTPEPPPAPVATLNSVTAGAMWTGTDTPVLVDVTGEHTPGDYLVMRGYGPVDYAAPDCTTAVFTSLAATVTGPDQMNLGTFTAPAVGGYLWVPTLYAANGSVLYAAACDGTNGWRTDVTDQPAPEPTPEPTPEPAPEPTQEPTRAPEPARQPTQAPAPVQTQAPAPQPQPTQAPPPPAPSRQTASRSYSCAGPATVTFSASGGGTVEISGSASASGSGSASVTIDLPNGGSASITASAEGSIAISRSWNGTGPCS